jgi:hypothetical protein
MIRRRERPRDIFGINVMVPLLVALTVACFLSSASTFADAAPRRFPVAVTVNRRTITSIHSWSPLDFRGGSQEDYDDEDQEEESGDEVDDYAESGSSAVFSLLGKAVQAVSRALQAVFLGNEPSEDGEVSFVTSIIRTVQRKFSAEPKAKVEAHRSSDFGEYLAKSYGVEATRNELEKFIPVMGGSIGAALSVARSKARLLVVLIPASKPAGKGKTKTHDQEAIEGFLSAEVSKIAGKRAHKTGETGSFVLWSAKAGSPEAVQAIKRLKAQQANSKGQKRPILAAVYPAQALDSKGVPKVVPRLLAQHHCSPPPSPEQMSSWLNALRKRHAKQFGTMQLELRETMFYKDRKEGYIDSMQSDKDRLVRERKEEAERVAKEKAEQAQRDALKKRREELRASLPDEPGKDIEGVKTVALRLADGRSCQRRFAPDVTLSTLFDWVDATFEIERETVILTTMNGQNTFSWDSSSQTLEEAGLGRLVGLRVTQSNPETSEKSENGEESAKPTTTAS